MPELDDELYEKIATLSENINSLIEKREYAEALALCWKGWDLLPEPKTQWEAATWFLATIGDVNFITQDFKAAFDNLKAVMHCPDGIGNPFLHLRLGQAALEIKDEARAADELTRAYAIAGIGILKQEPKKYYDFLKQHIKLEKW